jgi:hypothetical protein
MAIAKILKPIKTLIAPSPHTNPIAYSPHQTAIAPHHPQNPDRLSPQIKQRSPITQQNLIAYSLNTK